MKKYASLFALPGLIAFGLATLGSFAMAEEVADTPAATPRPIVAELFTSQSCSSCPAAERFFDTLVEDENIIVIQWHVDYWDNLVHGRAGKWKDPYSKPAYTERQRDYNYALRGMGSVYTPQAVIGGIMETTGSRKRSVKKMLSLSPQPVATVDVEALSDSYRVRVSGVSDKVQANAETLFVKMLKQEATNIKGGENKGRSTQSRNVAVDAKLIGDWAGQRQIYSAPILPSADYTCAIIVQEKSMGRILGAAYCPD